VLGRFSFVVPGGAIAVALVAFLIVGGGHHDDATSPPAAAIPIPVAPSTPRAPALAHVDSPAPVAAAADAPAFTFAVLSDIHFAALPTDTPPLSAQKMIATLVAVHPRFVVITGDSTNGNLGDAPGQVRYRIHAWRAIRKLIAPLRAAGIPVLPIAGNHDSYLPGMRQLYADTFADLAALAAPIEIHGSPQPAHGLAIDAAPFCYSVDVLGVHLTLAHLVDQHVDPGVGAWMAQDLAGARGARLRLVFGHVPMSSVITHPNARFKVALGELLEAGHADLYVAGHEHLVWDQNVRLPDGTLLRQVLVGTATGEYDYGPTDEEKREAGCVPHGRALLECHIPNSGAVFDMKHIWNHSWIETQRATLTLIRIDGTTITATPIAVDKRGRISAFGVAAQPGVR
jgi:hypothetical protein